MPSKHGFCHPPAPVIPAPLGCVRGAGARPVSYAGAVHLGPITVVVSECDPAISFFVDALGFEPVNNSPAVTNDGRPSGG